MKKILLFIVVVIAGLLLSNPNSEKHKAKIAESFKESNPLTGILVDDKYIERFISYEDHYFYSFSKISINNKKIAIGLAGFVFVFQDLDLSKYQDLLNK